MSLLIIKNISHEGPGIIEEIISRREIDTRIVDLGNGEELPDITEYRAVVVLGGPQCVNDNNKRMKRLLPFVKDVIQQEIPYLGICLGMQALAKSAGAEVFAIPRKEVGWRGESGDYYKVNLTDAGVNDRLLDSISFPVNIFHLHSETISYKKGISLLAKGKDCKNQIIRVGEMAYGIQGHFELTKEMMLDWNDKDPDLRWLNRNELIADFKSVKAEYLKLGVKLFENFLDIAGFEEFM